MLIFMDDLFSRLCKSHELGIRKTLSDFLCQKILKYNGRPEEILLQKLHVGHTEDFRRCVVTLALAGQVEQHTAPVGVQCGFIPVVDDNGKAFLVRRRPRLVAEAVDRIKNPLLHFPRDIRMIVQSTRYRRRRNTRKLGYCRDIIFLISLSELFFF